MNKLNIEEVLTDPNQNFVSSLEKGLEVLKKDLKRNVKLHFVDRGNALPELYSSDIRDIIVQLMRNSVAHGIEAEEERLKAGKPAEATISIEAKIENDMLKLSYQDDGIGLDKDKILRHAVSKGIITHDQARQASPETIVKLIFQKGLSTSADVDQHSGRGEGLGLVLTILRRLNGKFKVASKFGKAFRIEILLPLESSLNEAV